MNALRPVRSLRSVLFLVLLALVATLTGCAAEETTPADLQGSWRAVLQSPGGELPFVLVFESLSGELRPAILNGEERVSTSGVELDGRNVTISFEWYDSEITASLTEPGRLVGQWRRTSAEGENTVMDFAATRHSESAEEMPPRFGDPGETDGAQRIEEVTGDWQVLFRDESGEEPARGEFEQQGPLVRGTFLTPTGDYRYLEGRYDEGLLRLSTFDGAHAFLFQARATAEGTLEGDFWSRDSYHATWTATPTATDEDFLPDPWQEVTLTNDEGLFRFSFPDVASGETVSYGDARFDGKVVLVNIFGTWCPNCNDKAPLLSAWHRRYLDQGLEMVGLAYEFTGDPKRDGLQVRRFARRHGITYPLLLAGISDKKAAAQTLPDLSAVRSYPTTVFIGRDGTVRAIHSGFAGPGTGEHHSALVAEHEALIQKLLAEGTKGATDDGDADAKKSDGSSTDQSTT